MPRYRIDPDRSQVWIDARSSLHPIQSRTNGLEGFIDIEVGPDGGVDFDVAPAGKLSLSVSRLSSGNRMEDRELQKRIDARRYPTIEGVLDGLQAADQDGGYRVSGAITFRGVSRRHEDMMTITPVDGDAVQMAGKSRFDVRDFGMEPPKILMLKVEPEVDVRVEILAVKEV